MYCEANEIPLGDKSSPARRGAEAGEGANAPRSLSPTRVPVWKRSAGRSKQTGTQGQEGGDRDPQRRGGAQGRKENLTQEEERTERALGLWAGGQERPPA